MHPKHGADCASLAYQTVCLVARGCFSGVAIVLGAVLLASVGCKTVGKDYTGVAHPPVLPEYFQVTNLPKTDGCPSCGLPEAASWNNIDDGVLGQLIARGLEKTAPP